MRRLPEHTAELATEVGARKAGRASQVADIERIRVTSIDQIPGPQQVTLRRHNLHARSIATCGSQTGNLTRIRAGDRVTIAVLADRRKLGEELAGFVYGTIVVLSVIVTGAKAFPHGLGHIALLVGVTTIVFWLAHVYAHVLAFSLSHDTHLSLAEFAHIARREASILAAGVPPEAALVLGAIGLFGEDFAIWLSFGLGLAVLGVTGIVFARVERLGAAPATMVVLANLALGIVLIGLKVLIVH